MKILSNRQLTEIIQQTVTEQNISVLDLMESTADAIATEISTRWQRSTPIAVFAGWGNNGAEALLTAIALLDRGYRTDVYFFNINDKATPEARIARDRLLKCPAGNALTFTEITGREPFSWPEPTRDTLVVDGIFGSGLTKELPVSFQMLIANINESGAKVVAIDMPSGLNDEWNDGLSHEKVLHATLTLTLARRLAFMFADNADLVGEVKVLDIGLSRSAINAAALNYYYVEKETVRQYLPNRQPFCSKNDFGSVLIAGGSYGMYGAPTLAANGALRTGAGKVTVFSPSTGMPVIQSVVPCAMFMADDNPRNISSFPNDLRYNVVAVGPGMDTADVTVNALEVLIKSHESSQRPLVLDADALNCIAKRPRLLDYLPVLTVITPHTGEFDRIFGEQSSSESRLKKAIEVAQYHRIIIVLKGRNTAIVRPDGKVFFNSSGSPAMATPGSGDVLTGVIASFIAQGLKPEIATFIGCYVHGVAGQLASRVNSHYGVTAGDIAVNLGRAIASIQEI